MGVIKSGILGGFSGKVGGVVGSSWKGISTIKAMPQSVFNPRTNAQVANRTRFTFVRDLAAECLTTIVKPLNDRFAQRMSGYNLFCSRSAKAMDGNGTFVPAELKLSAGKLGDTEFLTVAAEDNGTLSVTWNGAIEGNYQRSEDKCYILVVDNIGTVVGVSSGTQLRMHGNATIQAVADLHVGSDVYFYMSFLRQDGTFVSNSVMSSCKVQA